MQSAELEAWLRLGLIPRLGPVKFRKLLSKFGDPDSALGASNSVLAGVVGTGLAAAISDGPDSNLLASTLEWPRAQVWPGPRAAPGNASLAAYLESPKVNGCPGRNQY